MPAYIWIGFLEPIKHLLENSLGLLSTNLSSWYLLYPNPSSEAQRV